VWLGFLIAHALTAKEDGSMTSKIIHSVGTAVPCPGRDCTAVLTRLTRQVDGTPRTFDDWVCPTGAQHVPQQWEPPAEYEVL
jgi:hypothetical protein